MSAANQTDLKPTPEVLTVQEVAEFLRVHRSTMYRLVKSGGIECLKIGGTYRFMASEVEKFTQQTSSIGLALRSVADGEVAAAGNALGRVVVPANVQQREVLDMASAADEVREMNWKELGLWAIAELEYQAILEQAPKMTRSSGLYVMMLQVVSIRGVGKPTLFRHDGAPLKQS